MRSRARRLPALLLAAGAMLAFAPAVAAAPITFQALLDGPSENPPNASPGTGMATVIFDLAAHTMRVIADFSDLIGTTTAAHIHCCVAPPGNVGVATVTPSFTGFPLGVTSGSYDFTYDTASAASFNPSFVNLHGSVVAAEAALVAGLQAGEAYLNIHTSVAGGGEIRGFLTPVPEPAALGLFGVGLGGLALAAHRRAR